MDLGRTAEAEASFALAEEFGRPDATGYPSIVGNRLANAHAVLAEEYRNAGALDESIAQYRRALELRPTYIDVRVALARALLDAQRFPAAADELDRVLAAQPDQIEALLLRGLAAYYSGALNTANASWDRAAAVDPADRRVAVYRSMLARKQGGALDE